MLPFIKPARIAFLASILFHGGATTSLFLLLKSIHHCNFKKYLFCRAIYSDEMFRDISKYSDKLQLIELAEIHNYPGVTTSSLSFFLKKRYSFKKFVDILLSDNVDILHINTTVLSLVLRCVKENSNIKTVVHVREVLHKKSNNYIGRSLIEEISKYSDAIIAISDNEAEPFRNHPGLHIVPNPFDFSALNYQTNTFRKDHQIPDNYVLVGMMGQFYKEKGHLDFLKALKIMRKCYSAEFPFCFVIIGVYPESPKWKRIVKKIVGREDYRGVIFDYISRNGLSPYLKLVPYSYQILGILKDMDIMVRPSLAGDPWGRDIIEAMALGKPVVATGSSEFYVENGRTGYLVPSGKPDQLAQKILTLINNPDMRKEFGEQGFLKVRRMCDLERYGQTISHIYKSLLDPQR